MCIERLSQWSLADVGTAIKAVKDLQSQSYFAVHNHSIKLVMKKLKTSDTSDELRISQTRELAKALEECLDNLETQASKAGALVAKLVDEIWNCDLTNAFSHLTVIKPLIGFDSFKLLLDVGRGVAHPKLVYMASVCTPFLRKMTLPQQKAYLDNGKTVITGLDGGKPQFQMVEKLTLKQCQRAFVENGSRYRERTLAEYKAQVNKEQEQRKTYAQNAVLWYQIEGNAVKLLARRTVQRGDLARLLILLVNKQGASSITPEELELAILITKLAKK